MLAYHWGSALELVRAAGAADDELAERARYALRDAGDRAFSLNSFAVAVAQYEDALALWPDDAERPELLFKRAVALHWSYDDRQEEALEAARDALIAVGDSDRASETESFLSRVHWDRGQHDLVREHLARAEALAGDSVSAAAARVLAVSGRIRAIAGEHEEGRRLAEAALVMATELRLDELHAHALTTIGMAKYDAGDLGSGVKDMERALEIALAVDSPIAGTIVNNLAVYATFAGDFPRTDELYGEALRLAERYGDASTRPFRRRKPHLARLHARALGSGARVGGCIHRRMRGGLAAHAGGRGARGPGGSLDRPRRPRAAHFETSSVPWSSRNAQRDPFQHLASLASTAVIYAELGRLDDGYSLAVQVAAARTRDRAARFTDAARALGGRTRHR